jgi:HD-GYP domain-containing protein (c-di-GMP phosphodiesterase class II)
VVRQLEDANTALSSAQAKLRMAASGLITALAVALDQRDPYTEGHSQRVATHATWAGHELGLTPEQLEIVAYSAKAHDIGKIGIPDDLLRKPGRLSESEWQLMREHPARGVEIIAQLDFLPKAGLDSIGQHHERLDGSGYPHGLSGDTICLGARVIAVADALDAMTTVRPYQGVRTPHEAFRELRMCAGELFDAEVVEAMEHGWRRHS